MSYNNFYDFLKRQSFDGSRINLLKNIVNKANTNFNNNESELNEQKFNLDFNLLLDTFSFDSGRLEALKILIDIDYISDDHLFSILDAFSFDSGKTEAVKILTNQPHKPNEFNYGSSFNLEKLRKSYSHSKEFISAATQLGFNTNDLEKYGNEIDCNIELNGVSIDTKSLKPGDTITLNGLKVTKWFDGSVTIG